MDSRRRKILEAIMDSFIQHALPVGSKHLCDHYNFKVSSATIRNEMAALEDEGYIIQPHTSAGRIPTNRAYRMMVDQMILEDQVMKRARTNLMNVQRQYDLRKTKERLYDLTTILAAATQDISFATLPNSERLFYIGVSNILKKPEFASNPVEATRVIESIENELYDILSDLEITDEGGIYIGDENILSTFQSCSLLAVPYHYHGFDGVIGILGSTRMDYAYNMAALKTAVMELL